MSNKARNILTGWLRKYKIIEVEDATAKLSELRLKHCAKHGVPSKSLKFINGEAKEVSQIYCPKCKCPCEQKSLVVGESCEVSGW